ENDPEKERPLVVLKRSKFPGRRAGPVAGNEDKSGRCCVVRFEPAAALEYFESSDEDRERPHRYRNQEPAGPLRRKGIRLTMRWQPESAHVAQFSARAWCHPPSLPSRRSSSVRGRPPRRDGLASSSTCGGLLPRAGVPRRSHLQD